MNEANRLYKQLYKGGYAAYGILTILAIVFYKERTIFLDIAFHLFHILRSGGFAFQVHRYSAALTQVFPLAGAKLSLPLDAIMLLYSAGVMIYYTACYWLCGSVLKNYRAGLVLLISQLLLLSSSFYWMQSELQQGLAFSIIVFAWLTRPEMKQVTISGIIISIVLLVIAGFFHPLVIVPMIFAFLFFLAGNTVPVNRKLLLFALAACVVIYFLKSKLLANHYDEGQMKGLDNFSKLFPHYVNLPSNRKFVLHFFDKYYWVPLLSILTGVVYIYHKKWLSVILYAAFVIGFILLVNVSYPTGAEKDFYMENLYLPLGILLALPLVFDVFPAIGNKKIIIAVFVLITGSGIARIYLAHYERTARLTWERNFLEQNFDKKILVSDSEVPMDTLIMTWGTPYEFWLLSTTEYGKTASIVIDEDIDRLLWCKWENKEFITIMENTKYEDLPPAYFKLHDTVTHYDRTGAYETTGHNATE